MTPFKFRLNQLLAITVVGIAFCSCKDSDSPSAPTVTELTPAFGLPSSLVAIRGDHFSPSIDQNKVTFNGVDAIVESASEKQINVVVPAGATSGPVAVTVNGMPASTKPTFTVDHPDAVVNLVSPTKVKYNVTIKITGHNFYPTPTNNLVTINGVAAVVEAATETELTVRIPARTGSGDVVVNGVAAAQRIEYVPDVFVAFNEETLGLGKFVAQLWINGVVTPLSSNPMTSYVADVVLVGEDVYAVGDIGGVATVWKNAVPTTLTSELQTAPRRIQVVNGDVYIGGIAGYDKSGNAYAAYWKNGVWQLASPPAKNIEIHGLEIKDGIVYIAGSAFTTGWHGALWKNNQATYMTEPTQLSGLWDMRFHNGDTYLIGEIQTPHVNATLWKNGIPTSLFPATAYTVADNLAFSGDDLYILGEVWKDANKTSVWLSKNGNVEFLDDGTGYHSAASLEVIGSDTHVLTSYYNGSKSIVTYTKNGVRSYLTNGLYNTIATKIVVR